MISPWDVIGSVAWVYLLVLAGAIARKANLFAREYDEGIMKMVYMIMLPCFILDKILGSEILRNGTVLLSASFLGFALILGGIGIGALVGRIIGLHKGTGMRTFALGSGSQNYGFTAAPVVEALWSTSALAVLFVHNIGVELALWSVGVMIMSGEKGFPWRKLLNGMFIAVAIGLILIFLRMDHLITGAPRKAISMLGASAFPLGVFIIGCTIMDLIGAEKPSFKIISAALVVRLLLIPAFFLSAAKFLPIAEELKQVIVVQAAMPAAVTPIILARLYGGRAAIAVHIVVITTVLSIFSLPWIIAIGCDWIGLKPLLP